MMPSTSTVPERSKPSFLAAIDPVSMRIPDACRFTGISRSTLYLLIARGEVEVVKLGSSTLVVTESLRAIIQNRRSPKREQSFGAPVHG